MLTVLAMCAFIYVAFRAIPSNPFAKKHVPPRARNKTLRDNQHNVSGNVWNQAFPNVEYNGNLSLEDYNADNG